MSDESSAGPHHTTRNVPAREIDKMVDNALWCATANAQDGYLTDRSFMDSFESAIGWVWPFLLDSWDTPDARIEAETEQEGIDAFA